MFRVISCLSGEHDPRLVSLAVFVCFVASFVGIKLLGHARATKGHARVGWLALAGVATGCGIWATHFIAMLAYEPGVPVAYDTGLTGLSLILAAVITGIGFSLAINHPGLRRSALAGAVVGAGVASMHFTGMWALDILVVPHALGQRVTFMEGEGPRLDALNDPAALGGLRAEIDHQVLAPVYDTIARVRQDLPETVTFLGFCGAPWTLATYMIAGQGTPNQLPARLFAWVSPAEIAAHAFECSVGSGWVQSNSRPTTEMRQAATAAAPTYCRRA